MVAINHLAKSYQNNVVYDDFSFHFKPGINGLLGDNGSGKTTLFNCIYGTEKFKGEINRSSSVTYLPNEPWFYPRVRGMEYLEFVCEMKGVKPDMEKIERINSFFNLPLKKFAANYSTGMKKKLGLISVFATDSDVYLLDEPFNGLDLKGAMVCRQLIKSLQSEGKVILLSSHVFEHLKEVCFVIHHLEGGQVKRSYDRTDFPALWEEIDHRYRSIDL
ncbi:MAG: ABC transporter ATP-binding protein [Candidatus Thermoplasmatota archaeon]|nr:ABC transporter ATP-binding protein [Candidatus Thermoplasmatota archaeon]